MTSSPLCSAVVPPLPSYDFDVSSLADASNLTADGDADEHLRVDGEDEEDSDASDSDSDGEGGRRKRRRLSGNAEADGDPERQRAILRQGSSAITKTGFIRSAKKFRWVKLDDPVDTAKLCHPQALTKFCFFLMDALRERGARMKPLICACLAREPEIGADYFHDMFESSWIVLDVVAVSSFMIRLTKKL